MPDPAREDRVWDAVIVGAGPAGSTCARELAVRGYTVQVVEKASWPRYKTCGGGLIGRVDSLLELDLTAIVERRVSRAILHLEDLGQTFSVERNRGLVSLCMRSRLDDLLMVQAQAAGAAFTADCELTGMQPGPGGWTLTFGDRRLQARFVVGADGAGSRVARLAGWREPRRLVPAIESEVEVDEPTHRRFDSAVRFDFGPVPAGYSWVFPKAGHLSVGCLTYDRRRESLRQHLTTYLEGLGIHPVHRQDHGFAIPVHPRAGKLARNRVLLAGDAAGLADPVTCEGISYAIASGRLAADAICRPAGQGVEATYQRALEASILPDLRRARLLARLLYRSPRTRKIVFRRLGHPLAEAMADLISGRTSYVDLLGSPTRWVRIGWSLLVRPAALPTQTGR